MPETPPDEYVRRYRESITPSKMKVAFEKAKKKALVRGISTQIELGLMQAKTKEILCKHGIAADLFHFYIAYAEELYYKVARYEWLTDRIREHKIIRYKWEKRGLLSAVLDDIDKAFPWYGGRTK